MTSWTRCVHRARRTSRSGCRTWIREGVECQLAFPSAGFWSVNIKDAELSRAVARAWNEWSLEEVMSWQKRIFTPAIVPLVEPADAAAEVEWAAEQGFQSIFLPCTMPAELDWGLDLWEPLWSAADANNMVLAYHIGTGGENVVYRGPGGAVVNYMETTYPGMRVVSHLVAGGALDRHPDLKVLIAEGGAGWVPAIGDRMDEAYRQHGMFVRPRLNRLPSEIVRQQVYASFQHDISAVQIIEDTGYNNVLWGDDYPHLEGTYGHTQETLHQLFDSVDPRIKQRVLRGTFEELFSVPKLDDNCRHPVTETAAARRPAPDPQGDWAATRGVLMSYAYLGSRPQAIDSTSAENVLDLRSDLRTPCRRRARGSAWPSRCSTPPPSTSRG